MTEPQDLQPTLLCPRCRAAAVQTLAESPVKDVWTVYGCKTCFYTWRSTEAPENTDPEKYPVAFRLDPVKLQNYPIVPAIPPLRRK